MRYAPTDFDALTEGNACADMMHRIERLILSKAPYMMRVGGYSGGLSNYKKVRATPAMKQKALCLAYLGLPYAAIAKKIGVSAHAVNGWARKAGISRRPQNPATK